MAKKKEEAKKNGQNNSQQKTNKRTVQSLMPFVQCYQDGIIKNSANEYSKMYKMSDANFITEPESKQEDILVQYQKMLNKFPENVSLAIVIMNKQMTETNLAHMYHISEKGVKQDMYCQDYNKIIDDKIKEGRNDIRKEKYIILIVHSNSYDSAMSLFNTLDGELKECVKNINKQGVTALSLTERLELMYTVNNGAKTLPFSKQYEKYMKADGVEKSEFNKMELDTKLMKQKGITVKDMISPQALIKEKGFLQLGETRYCKSNLLVNLPLSLDTKFLTEVTNIPCEMVTTVLFSALPKKKAMNLVKVQNVNIKADVLKVTKKAYQEGYPAELVMDEDLQNAQQQARTIRNDVMIEGKKLFYVTITNTVFGEDMEEVTSYIGQLKMKCEDFGLQPNVLLGQQVKGWQSSLLTGGKYVSLDRLLTSDSAISVFPFNIQELQDNRGHFYGINSVSKNMIMYDRKRSKLANGLIFGQSGSGKSFITKGEVIPNLLDGDDEMIILDPENEYRVIADAFDGNVIDLKPKSDFHINPCDLDMEYDEPDASPLVEKCDFMVGLVESILGRGRECNSFEVNVIHRATNKMYEEYTTIMDERREQGSTESIDTSICPTLVDFYNNLIADNSPEGNKIAMAVEPYCIGNYNLFAHRTNIQNTGARITVYNLLYLPEKMKEMAMKVCLSSIWNKIVKNRENNDKMGTSKAIWVYLDEFHLFFQTESSATTIMAYFKRVRKYNGIMTGITQDVADLLNTRQGTAMFNNTGFFIFLNQSPKGRQYIQELFDVSDALIDNIKDKPSGVGLIYNGSCLIPFNYRLSADTNLYKIMSTNPNDKKDNKKADEQAENAGTTGEMTEENKSKRVVPVLGAKSGKAAPVQEASEPEPVAVAAGDASSDDIDDFFS